MYVVHGVFIQNLYSFSGILKNPGCHPYPAKAQVPAARFPKCSLPVSRLLGRPAYVAQIVRFHILGEVAWAVVSVAPRSGLWTQSITTCPVSTGRLLFRNRLLVFGVSESEVLAPGFLTPFHRLLCGCIDEILSP
jgi:hypothetical protein